MNSKVENPPQQTEDYTQLSVEEALQDVKTAINEALLVEDEIRRLMVLRSLSSYSDTN